MLSCTRRSVYINQWHLYSFLCQYGKSSIELKTYALVRLQMKHDYIITSSL